MSYLRPATSLCLLLALSLSCCAQLVGSGAAQAAGVQSLVVRHVTVVDTASGQLKRDLTVVIIGNRIATIGKNITIPAAAKIIDARGKFLIPGLWDMHVHTGAKEIFFPLYLANGITGVRDMGGNQEQPTGNLSIRFDLLKQWREEIRQGTLLGPRLIVSGFMVDGPEPLWPGGIPVKTAEDGRRVVDELKQQGVDFIKIYSALKRDGYFAIAEEAKKQSIPFAGHLPDAIMPDEAADAGQRSIEHLAEGLLLVAVSRKTAELRKQLEEVDIPGIKPVDVVTAYLRVGAEASDTYDEAKAAEMLSRFARNETWQVPTLVQLRAEFYAGRDESSPQLKYISLPIRAYWSKGHPFANIAVSPEYEEMGRKTYRKHLQLVAAMQFAHVGILAGSDSANPYVYPGFSLHEELKLLVEAGLTPLQALQTATLNPAKFLHLEDALGTVEQGKLADLVLLNANPLANISNTRKIAGVVVNGRYLSPEKLKQMLGEVEAAAHHTAGKRIW